MPKYILNGLETEIQYPAVMGILNLTLIHSATEGNLSNQQMLSNRFFRMHSEGAQIIDIGAESTRQVVIQLLNTRNLAEYYPYLKKYQKISF